jgi:hypothetical protein
VRLRRRGYGRAGSRMAEQLDKDKTNAMAFYDLMFNQCRPAEAIEKYVGDV